MSIMYRIELAARAVTVDTVTVELLSRVAMAAILGAHVRPDDADPTTLAELCTAGLIREQSCGLTPTRDGHQVLAHVRAQIRAYTAADHE